jgi:hypothetical protein
MQRLCVASDCDFLRGSVLNLFDVDIDGDPKIAVNHNSEIAVLICHISHKKKLLYNPTRGTGYHSA